MTIDIAAEVAAERERQDAQWGGPEHDDQHEPIHWLWFVSDQVSKGETEQETNENIRARLVKIAALAFAGIAAIDRQAGGETNRG